MNWFSRIHREYEAGNLTLHFREVLVHLGRFHPCRFGIFPSHAVLAMRARVSVSTVQRALSAARRLGLLDWAERRVRQGWRSLKASNRYVLKVPAGPVCTTGQQARGETYKRKKAAHEVPQLPLSMALAALAEVAARRMRALGFA